MSWLGFLFPKPSLARFATDLIASAARAGTPGWRYSPEMEELHSPNGNGRMALNNVFLEYTNAKSSARSELIRKYVSIMISIETEVPKLWTMAQKSIYPVLRSRRDTVALQIQSRGETKPFAPRVDTARQQPADSPRNCAAQCRGNERTPARRRCLPRVVPTAGVVVAAGS